MSGYRRIYSDEAGRLFTRGSEVFGAEPQEELTMDDFGNDDLGYDEMGGMDYASLGEDEDDDMGGMDYPSLSGMDYASLGDEDEDDLGNDENEYEELGAKKRRARKGGKKSSNRRFVPRGKTARRPQPQAVARAVAQQIVQKTILVGQTARVIRGLWTIVIRPQFDFVAEDMSFTGSVNGQGAAAAAIGAWSVTTIQFGDRIIFSNPVGVPIAIFVVGGFMRGLVKGAAIAAGLDILITANLTNANASTPGQLIATFTGLKRGTTGCGPGAV